MPPYEQLSLILATSWSNLRFAIIECLSSNFLVTYLSLTTNTALLTLSKCLRPSHLNLNKKGAFFKLSKSHAFNMFTPLDTRWREVGHMQYIELSQSICAYMQTRMHFLTSQKKPKKQFWVHWVDPQGPSRTGGHHFVITPNKTSRYTTLHGIWWVTKFTTLILHAAISCRKLRACEIDSFSHEFKQNSNFVDSASMIHSAKPTVPTIAIIILTWNLFCFARFWNVGRTDTTGENSDHYRPWLWVGLEDQFKLRRLSIIIFLLEWPQRPCRRFLSAARSVLSSPTKSSMMSQPQQSKSDNPTNFLCCCLVLDWIAQHLSVQLKMNFWWKDNGIIEFYISTMLE